MPCRRRLTKTFNMGEEENEPGNNEERLVRRKTVDIVNTLETTPQPVKDIIRNFGIKSPRPLGITRNMLLNAHENVFRC